MVLQSKLDRDMYRFSRIVCSKAFYRTPVVVLFNNYSLFKEKLSTGASPIRRYFPTYSGDERDSKAGSAFFIERFAEKAKSRLYGMIFVHKVDESDTDIMDKVVRSVTSGLCSINLEQLGAVPLADLSWVVNGKIS
jgi:guanine nucleotide-binding protein subunit alpha, other